MIYASTVVVQRNEVWDVVFMVMDLDSHMLILDDFNVIMHPLDKKGGKAFHLSREVKNF